MSRLLSLHLVAYYNPSELDNSAGKSGKQQINNLWPGRFVKGKRYEETSMDYSTMMLMLVKDDCGKPEQYVFRQHVT